MEDRERKACLSARLRNLKRKHAKLMNHSDLIEEAIEIDREIKSIEKQIAEL